MLEDPLTSSAMILSCASKPSAYTPIWIMRQAGRYMPSYRKIREKVGFLELCKNPDLAAEVTLLPIQELGVDAAIIFADILLILESLGANLSFAAGEGPVISNPIRKDSDITRLQTDNLSDSLSYVYSAIKKTRSSLNNNIPLIGFSGAPFTLASYFIEGGSVGNLSKTKTFMYSHPHAWQNLMEILTHACAQYLSDQIDAGANIVQIFDSWLGSLSPADFIQYVLPYSKKLVSAIKYKAPVIYFGTSTSTLLPYIEELGAQIIGLDWRTDLSLEWKKLNYKVAVQGNLDPIVLLSDKQTIAQQTKRILKEAAGRPGHIFNLGHGVLPETPLENVKYLVELVHEISHSTNKEYR